MTPAETGATSKENRIRHDNVTPVTFLPVLSVGVEETEGVTSDVELPGEVVDVTMGRTAEKHRRQYR